LLLFQICLLAEEEARAMASVRGLLNIQSLNELTYENTKNSTTHAARTSVRRCLCRRLGE